MTRIVSATLAMAGVCAFTISAIGASKANKTATQSPDTSANTVQPAPLTKFQRQEAFRQTHLGTSILERSSQDGRISRIHGSAFSTGRTAMESAEQFRQDHAQMFGVNPAELVASDEGAARFADDSANVVPHVQPLMYDPDTQTYKFTAVNYRQVRDGIPVFRSRMVLTVRNEAGFPMVLANPDVRDLGGFAVDAALAGKANPSLAQIVNNRFGAGSAIIKQSQVIFAGVDDQSVAPRLADQSIVINGPHEWLLLTDTATGAVLHEEYLICFGTVSGNASGLATEGIAADFCANEVSTPMPYVRITSGAVSVFADANGNFVIDPGGATITATPSGMWFNVTNIGGSVESLSVPAAGPASLVFNSANATQQVRAQTNAYIQANVVRDFALSFNPAYPTLQNQNFPITVNNTGGLCPGNAWYSPTEQSINFCLSGPSNPNTAWSSVVHHEYGHHLVNAGGSGQGAYGEGMGDVMSTLILDDPRLGQGFFNDCNTSLRNASNNCNYLAGSCSTCGSAAHTCGQLISGCVWETRNALIATNPSDYTDILGNLAVNAILVHTGTTITPSITVDYLTLDDDNADISDGTPHYAQINAGFSAHNMPAPPLSPIKFNYPNGRPTYVSPDGGTTMRVEVQSLGSSPLPGTGKIFIDSGSGFVQSNMTVISPNVYDAVFPAAPCGTPIRYYVQAQSTALETVNSPGSAPATFYSALSAVSAGPTLFTDNFQTNQGWAVTNSPGLTTGQWERGTPVASSAAPSVDGDGSGQCYVTQLTAGQDVDNGSTTLTSPALNANVAAPVLSYWRWYNNNTGAAPQADTLVVEFSNNDGASWLPLETVGPTTGSPNGQVTGGWFNKSFNLNTVPGFVAGSQFRVRFTCGDLGSGSYVEAAVDGVKIDSLICEGGSVPGDVDGDGDADLDDLLAVINSWGACSGCPADLTGNGAVDIDDLLQVINNWT